MNTITTDLDRETKRKIRKSFRKLEPFVFSFQFGRHNVNHHWCFSSFERRYDSAVWALSAVMEDRSCKAARKINFRYYLECKKELRRLLELIRSDVEVLPLP